MNPVQWVGSRIYRDSLQNTDPALTFARLLTSRHLADLQWISFIVILMVIIVLPLEIRYSDASIFAKLPIVTTLVTVVTAILSWVYQSGNRRMGVVDLFACEISVICRVILVADFARSSVAAAKAPPEDVEPPGKFTSEERYTPVYDTQLSYLQPLDVKVVSRVTEFYTYRMAVLDYMRATAATTDMNRRNLLRAQMIYMQFLMYESARLSIDQLIEFEPNLAESTINILCSELVVYAFLWNHHANDYLGPRLRLRLNEYSQVVPRLYDKIMRGEHPTNWERARKAAPEMMERYEMMRREIGLQTPG